MDRGPLIYRRELFDPSSWRDFSVGHLSFVLHRLTGWLLLGWVAVHLVIPLGQSSTTTVYTPTAAWLIVSLLAVLVFHSLNGIRLVILELGMLSPSENKTSFWVTIGFSALIVVLVGVGL